MSDDDSWLRELAQVNREEETQERSRLDERWDRLSSGDLSPEEEAELRALAESSEEAHEAYEAFRPLGADFQASVVRALQERDLVTEAAPPAMKPRAGLLPFPRRVVRFAGWSAAVAAAVLVLVLLLRPPVPLPDYAYPEEGVSGGSSATRGGGTVTFAPGDDLQVVLSPKTAASRKLSLEARCFLLRGSELHRVEMPQSEFPPGGAVKMNGSLGRDLSPGKWTLWTVVGRQGELPDPAELQTELRAGRTKHADWQAVSADLEISRPASR
jgi:hypothetical protein